MKIYAVWTEGYIVTGQSSDATFWGLFEGSTFEDAVQSAVNSMPEEEWKSFDPQTLTWWGCKFYDNEIDARKNFG